VGRAAAAVAILLALAPSNPGTPGLALADFVPAILLLAWMAASAAFLLRGHGAAWVLFGLFTFGGREVLELVAQPASADRAAGGLATLVLFVATAILLAGRRIPETPSPIVPPAPPIPSGPEPTNPWSGTA
jgi:hypothetical protein